MRDRSAFWKGLLAALLLAGCAKQPAAGPEGAGAGSATQAGETFTNVVREEVEYYLNGPQQGTPPDGKFPPGTKVNILRRTGSYVLVRSESGVEAYVSVDAVGEGK